MFCGTHILKPIHKFNRGLLTITTFKNLITKTTFIIFLFRWVSAFCLNKQDRRSVDNMNSRNFKETETKNKTNLLDFVVIEMYTKTVNLKKTLVISSKRDNPVQTDGLSTALSLKTASQKLKNKNPWQPFELKENARIMCCFLVIIVLTLSIKIIRIDTESIIVTNYVIDERFY